MDKPNDGALLQCRMCPVTAWDPVHLGDTEPRDIFWYICDKCFPAYREKFERKAG
jgi:hypothetical protein